MRQTLRFFSSRRASAKPDARAALFPYRERKLGNKEFVLASVESLTEVNLLTLIKQFKSIDVDLHYPNF